MNRYELATDLYVSPTPTGAYYAVASPERDRTRDLVAALLALDATPRLSVEALRALTGCDDDTEAIALLLDAQRLGLVQGHPHALRAPSGALEDLVPELIEPLSDLDQSLLADGQGFCVCSRGFDEVTALELSALSADLASMHERHQGALARTMSLETGAWAMVDAVGSSIVGFWPLFIGAERFVLVVGGVPTMHRPQLTELIWTLSIRYADEVSAAVAERAALGA